MAFNSCARSLIRFPLECRQGRLKDDGHSGTHGAGRHLAPMIAQGFSACAGMVREDNLCVNRLTPALAANPSVL